ncbi:MAG TPA: LdpA C-terminal domain-containing domain [Trichocoleus sp.]
MTSLQEGHWFKLICGASYHHLPAIRNLALVYALAGADCIDLAADPAIVAAARSGLTAAQQLIDKVGLPHTNLPSSTWLMVSLNDGEDPHFRKAAFDPATCPVDCNRPCERICPTQAITFNNPDKELGVIDSQCYGCGRCIPICPFEQIYTRSYVSTPSAIAAQLFPTIDAIEIHTQIGRTQSFQRLWQEIQPWLKHLKLVAISCPDGEEVIPYLWSLWNIIQPLSIPLIWQTDGRPMSGDIGDGTTIAAIRFGQKVLNAQLPGYVQLAGGTNRHTVEKLHQLELLNLPVNRASFPVLSGKQPAQISGIAYGSYARKLVMPILTPDESMNPLLSTGSRTGNSSQFTPLLDKSKQSPSFSLPEIIHLEEMPDLLEIALGRASSLVLQLKEPWINEAEIVKRNRGHDQATSAP